MGDYQKNGVTGNYPKDYFTGNYQNDDSTGNYQKEDYQKDDFTGDQQKHDFAGNLREYYQICNCRAHERAGQSWGLQKPPGGLVRGSAAAVAGWSGGSAAGELRMFKLMVISRTFKWASIRNTFEFVIIRTVLDDGLELPECVMGKTTL